MAEERWREVERENTGEEEGEEESSQGEDHDHRMHHFTV